MGGRSCFFLSWSIQSALSAKCNGQSPQEYGAQRGLSQFVHSHSDGSRHQLGLIFNWLLLILVQGFDLHTDLVLPPCVEVLDQEMGNIS